MAGERRHSDTSDRDRRISLGWLAVEVPPRPLALSA